MQHSRIPVPFSAQKIPLTNLVSIFSAFSLFHSALVSNLATPQSADADSSPKRGAKGVHCPIAPMRNLCREALPLLG